MKKYFVLLLGILLLFIDSINAQHQVVPVDEQPAYFIYAKGARTDGKLKVLLISRHIIRVKDWPLPSIDTDLSLDFTNAFINDIERDERYFPADYDNIKPLKIELEDIYGGYLKWVKTAYYGSVTQNDNTLSAMEKIRAAFIQEHLDKGYRVYQLDFEPMVGDPSSEGGYYRAYKKSIGKYVPYQLERLSPLSPLWIPIYKKGEIRSRLSGLTNQSVSGGAGITIESSGDNRKDNSGTKGSSNTGSKVDNTDWAAVAAVKRTEAEAYEAEGDRLYKLGTLFYGQALQQYQYAQTAYPTPRVQARIDEINSLMLAGQAINKGLESMEKGSEQIRQTLDKAGIPRFRAFGFSYSGLMSSYKNVSSEEDQQSWEAAINYGFYRIFALEAGFGYFQSPTYDLYLTDKSGNKVDQSIRAYQTGAGFEMAFGLAFPIKPMVVYAMYGYNMSLFNASATMVSQGYEAPELKNALNRMYWQSKLKLGLKIRVPKSRVGFGIHYQMNGINGEKIIEEGSPYTTVKQGNYTYEIGGSVTDKYKFNRLGFSFYVLSK